MGAFRPFKQTSVLVFLLSCGVAGETVNLSVRQAHVPYCQNSDRTDHTFAPLGVPHFRARRVSDDVQKVLGATSGAAAGSRLKKSSGVLVRLVYDVLAGCSEHVIHSNADHVHQRHEVKFLNFVLAAGSAHVPGFFFKNRIFEGAPDIMEEYFDVFVGGFDNSLVQAAVFVFAATRSLSQPMAS